MRGIPLVFKRLDNDCIIPVSHPNITGTALGEKFGVSFGAACKWIRKWKKLIDY